jgi:hypothetical protein
MLKHRELRDQIEAVGYFPAILGDVIAMALADQTPRAFHVHPDVAFGHGTIGRHVSVLVLTDTRLIVVHADDHSGDEHGPAALAASAETIALSEIKAVAVSHIFDEPSEYVTGVTPRILRLTVSWGSTLMIDTEPAGCPDPDCEADHGYTGNVTNEDISLMVTSSLAGETAAADLAAFARALVAATAG